MNEQPFAFLKKLLATPGPSGDETAPANVWRAEARSFADSIRTDIHGNSFALLESDGPRVLLAGHIDEIGLMVSYIDDDGYLLAGTDDFVYYLFAEFVPADDDDVMFKICSQESESFFL